jgi:hypothetical protein
MPPAPPPRTGRPRPVALGFWAEGGRKTCTRKGWIGVPPSGSVLTSLPAVSIM